MSFQKITLAIAVTFLSTSTFAQTLSPSQWLREAFGTTKSCADRILGAVMDKCNEASKNDPSREHSCAGPDMQQHADNLYAVDLSYTVTDADVYSYTVTFIKGSSCSYQIK